MSVVRNVAVIDEAPGTKSRPAFKLRLASEKVTAGEIVRQRVETEVAAYNFDRTGMFRGLIEPVGAERVLNGYRLPRQKPIDAESQVKTALKALAANQVIMFVDDRQIDDPDEELAITDSSEIVFMKLVPLVGG